MALRVYSTLTREKLDFEKVTGKKPNSSNPADTVTMYVCGPTVYKPSHIGHMVGPVIFDTVKRYLTYLGYKVKWVVNITDVDDKLIQRAQELKTTVPELAAKMTEDYFACLKSLNVTGIDAFPRATQHIGGMIDVINALIKKDYAYEVDDGVYFDVSKDADYGKLSNRDPEQMEAGARMEPNPKKRNPGDFALWKSKPSEPAEVQFDSPFKCGRGRPGWHIECTCMASAELGETLDIHGGGLDLQFPHHENELAQSESWTGKPFARVWMHNGLLKLKSGKMAGSLGNVLNVADALKAVGGGALRFFVLNTHYRSPIDLGDWEPKSGSIPSNLESAKAAFETFVRFAERVQRITWQRFADLAAPATHDSHRKFVQPAFAEFARRFHDFLDDDFNTGGVTGVLFELVTWLNRAADQAKLEDPSTSNPQAKAEFTEGAALVKEIAQVLGLNFDRAHSGNKISRHDKERLQREALNLGKEIAAGLDELHADLRQQAAEQAASQQQAAEREDGLIQLLIDLRNNLRASAKEAAKDNPLKKALFDQTDLIRKRLGELGVTLEDRPGGTTWRVG